MTRPGDIYIKLKRPCPRCQGVLERYEIKAVAGEPNVLPRVHCTGCHVEWPSIREMIVEAQGGAGPERRGGPSLAQLKGYLVKIKAGVRAGRNVAGAVRAVSGHLAGIVGRVRDLEKAPDKQQVVSQVGADIEGIVDQISLAMEHIEEGRDGKIGPEPEAGGGAENDGGEEIPGP